MRAYLYKFVHSSMQKYTFIKNLLFICFKIVHPIMKPIKAENKFCVTFSLLNNAKTTPKRMMVRLRFNSGIFGNKLFFLL